MELNDKNSKQVEMIIEGLLFAAGDRVPIEKISDATEIDKKSLKVFMNNMLYDYNNSSRGIIIREINDGYQLCTRPEVYDSIKKAFQPRTKQGLSQAAFETLAIIAHNSPITKAKIEQIRGVNSDSAITKLIDRNLITEAGRLDSPGRPVVYKTTEEFLRCFGLKSNDDLPIVENINSEELEKTQEVDTSINHSEDGQDSNVEKLAVDENASLDTVSEDLL